MKRNEQKKETTSLVTREKVIQENSRTNSLGSKTTRHEKHAKPNFRFQWHITDRCNLACKHCYIEDNTSAELSTKEIAQVVDHLAEVLERWNYSGSVSLTGGEVLMRRDFEKIVKAIRKHGQFKNILVMTNGVQVSRETIEFLRDNECAVQVSIDGFAKQQHDEIRGEGNFDKAIATLRKLSESGIYTAVHYVVHRLNCPTSIDQLKGFFGLLEQAAVKQVVFSLLIPIGKGTEMRRLLLSPNEVRTLFNQLIEVSRDFPTVHLDTNRPLWAATEACSGGACPVGFWYCTILPNGDVLPCRRLPIVLGNLRNQSFYEIWYKSEILWKLREHRKIEVCGQCKLLDQCGGCRGMAYAVYGDYMARDPNCFLLSDGQGSS